MRIWERPTAEEPLKAAVEEPLEQAVEVLTAQSQEATPSVPEAEQPVVVRKVWADLRLVRLSPLELGWDLLWALWASIPHPQPPE